MKILIILSIILFIFSLIIFICAYLQRVNTEEERIKKLKLLNEINQLEDQYSKCQRDLNKINEDLLLQEKQARNYYETERNKINIILENEKQNNAQQVELFKENSQYAMKNYINNLTLAYDQADKEYDDKVSNLQKEYDKVHTELESLRATLVAANEARVREEEKKGNLSFYMLQITDADIEDIQKLNNIKPLLHSPVILSKLIWSSFFQKPYKALCSRVLNDAIITGIYKITDLTTDQCYIGQSVDIAKRWSDHIKAGLGIDNNGTNKLYKAMQSHGVENFTFELLESCERKLLDEKEKFFITLYQSDIYGLNVTKGNG